MAAPQHGLLICYLSIFFINYCRIDDIIDQEVQNLSGGELQRVALALCLGKPADVYLIGRISFLNLNRIFLTRDRLVYLFRSGLYFFST